MWYDMYIDCPQPDRWIILYTPSSKTIRLCFYSKKDRSWTIVDKIEKYISKMPDMSIYKYYWQYYNDNLNMILEYVD